MEDIIKSPSTTCRLCLSSNGTMESIFDAPNDHLPNEIYDLFQIEIKNVYDFPTGICIPCTTKLAACISFKHQCKTTNDHLLSKYEDRIELVSLDTKQTTLESNQPNNTVCPTDPIQVQDEYMIYEVETIVKDEVPKPIKAKRKQITSTSSTQNKKTFQMCQICGKMFGNLTGHMLVHSEHKYTCSYCGQRLKTKSNLRIHLNTHTGRKPYVCLVCEKAFSSPNYLRQHKITHSGERPYRCEICHKTFSYHHIWVRHNFTHSNIRNHECQICNKMFINTDRLKNHLRTHSGEKPYKCEYCPKSFTQAYNQRVHQRIHTKERPFKCDICHKDFAYNSILKTHMAGHAGGNRKKVNTEGSSEN